MPLPLLLSPLLLVLLYAIVCILQVFSSAKYPVAEKLEDYNSLFSNAKFTPNKHANYKLVKKMHHAPTDDDMRNKLKFYSVQVR